MRDVNGFRSPRNQWCNSRDIVVDRADQVDACCKATGKISRRTADIRASSLPNNDASAAGFARSSDTLLDL
jgi:hypothetical protein